ncbi:30S ribosomal protein S4 [bacterium]|nr:30S ribosomal protein S4 [bacterium]MBT4435261.1 30S ribosomal protein S4 [bacterium]MDG2446018.1 30S ribosomal protein S4 [Thermodesulfobacteriota bacterium]
MSRYTGPTTKLSRREGEELFLKGDRSFTDKAARRLQVKPGQSQSNFRQKYSEYAIRLREKQKLKRIFGLTEKQFRNNYIKAAKQLGVTGNNLISNLERRLDNVVYRLGFLSSRSEARQYVNHGHVLVNGKKVDICSYIVSLDDEIGIREKSRDNVRIKSSLESVARRGVPEWLELDSEKIIGKIKRLPIRDDFKQPIDEQLIIEFYSKL